MFAPLSPVGIGPVHHSAGPFPLAKLSPVVCRLLAVLDRAPDCARVLAQVEERSRALDRRPGTALPLVVEEGWRGRKLIV